MKPLQPVAMGLLIVGLVARFGGYDALADPAGWVLVLVGLRRLPAVPERRTLLGLAALALLVSCVVFWPATTAWLDEQHPSLRWALTLPQLAVQALLCRSLAARAAEHDDPRAVRWLRTCAVAVVVVALLPVVAFAAGGDEGWTYVAAGFAALLVIAVLFAHAARPWATRGGAGATFSAP